MKWEAKLVKHLNESRIAVIFDKDIQLIARIKQLDGAKWSSSKKYWHLPDNEENRTRFKITVIDKKQSNSKTLEEISKFSNWLKSKRYSDNTIKTYTEALKSFLMFFEFKSPEAITNEDVIIYNNDFILKNKLSSSYQIKSSMQSNSTSEPYRKRFWILIKYTVLKVLKHCRMSLVKKK